MRLCRLAMEDSCTKRYLGNRHSNFDWPIGVVQAILRIFRLRTERQQKRIGGEIIRHHRITDRVASFQPQQSPETLGIQATIGFRRLGNCRYRRRDNGLSVKESATQKIRDRN